MRQVRTGGEDELASVVQFESVGLRYGTGAEVLRDLDFTLSKGGFRWVAWLRSGIGRRACKIAKVATVSRGFRLIRGD